MPRRTAAWSSVLDLAGAIAGGIWRGPSSTEHLMALAQRRTGLADFGPSLFKQALDRLLAACAVEAELSLLGRVTMRWDALRLLSNLLRLRAEETQAPSIPEQPIERPIFITGLPRSGTTFLHRLLLLDARNQAPRVWQAIYPCPPAGRDRRIERVARQLRIFNRLTPEFRGLHPLDAASPQECCEISAHIFHSLRFDTLFRVPSYRDWLDRVGYLPAYRFQRRFLQHLQHQQGPAQWVLKCPDHVFGLSDLRSAFPDARVVFVHRDPVRVLLSVTKLTEVLRRPFTRRIDRLEIGRQESARWHEGSERMVEASERATFADALCHVHYLELVRNPLQTVRRLYGHLGMELTSGVAARISQFVAARPKGGYNHAAYRFADYGLDAAAEQEKFRRYVGYFGIGLEGGASGAP